jgi:predicted restriction endonuclease
MNASHIVPWKDGKSKQRLDQYNGLWLIPNLDRLFDRHLISFQEDGSLLVSRKLPEKEWAKLGINKGQKLRFVKPEMLPYLKKHRATLRKGEKSRS